MEAGRRPNSGLRPCYCIVMKHMLFSTHVSGCLLHPSSLQHKQYKFIVDGEWKYDPNQPAMFDEMGNVNNVIEVRTGTAGGGGATSRPMVGEG